jgi:hypothetical protein
LRQSGDLSGVLSNRDPAQSRGDIEERAAFGANGLRHRERQRRDPGEGGSRLAWMASSLALPRHDGDGQL